MENESQYVGFVRRLNNIIKVGKGGVAKQLRETTFEEIPKSELKPYGRKKRIKQIVEFGENGFKKVVYDRELQKEDSMQLELIEKTTDELPF